MVRPMTYILSAMTAACVSATALPQTPDGSEYEIACQATHEVACAGARCEVTGGDRLPVTVAISSRSGAGELCTFTYCRTFVLAPGPGEDVSSAVSRLTGYTLSASRGSTENDSGRPVIDYQLSVSAGHDTFMLFGAGDGGTTGWAGQCSRAPVGSSGQDR